MQKNQIQTDQYPNLVINQQSQGVRVLTRIKRELSTCTEFRFYVAFANKAGVASLIQDLEELQARKVKGRILVSQYLNFTEPTALRCLLKLDNLDLRIATEGSMHAKGYYFNFKNGLERYIVGSSNWTASALSTNTELNLHVETIAGSRFANEITAEFEFQFNKAQPVNLDFINSYEIIYEKSNLAIVQSRLQFSQTPLSKVPRGQISELSDESNKNKLLPHLAQEGSEADSNASTERQKRAVTGVEWSRHFGPNSMQLEALSALANLRKSGEKKALVISATGTGKTYLSAFDAKAFGARRMMFVVHRENIARAAMESFRQIFGSARTYGLYTGSNRDRDAEFLFCTVQTMSRPDHLKQFSSKYFDYIVIDESHRTGAESYARFLNHFEPDFLLGMTATPERTDGADIFKYFDHNIAYEIRLKRALEEKMLCPFHYFGITDLTVNEVQVSELTDFNQLTSNERVTRILEKAEFYGCDDGVIRGLVFCSRIDEARALSLEFNRRYYRTIALDGSSSEEERELAITRLEAERNAADKLDYIFTVDIFNEGVDIPQCNQIILLRPTQSSIVFVQQLGRGLRRLETKDKYLTVIDFIGNYTNNFLIPVALFGDRTYDKDRIRRLLVAGNECIPGSSTINFDRIAREKIFESINNAQTQLLRDLKSDFLALQARIGRLPMMCDFVEHDLRDPAAFVAYSKSFYAFSRTIETDTVIQIDKQAVKVLETYSRDGLSGKTLEEPLLLSKLLEHRSVPIETLTHEYLAITGTFVSPSRWESATRSIDLRFIRERVNGRLISVGEFLNLSLVCIDSKNIYRGPDFDVLLNDPTLLCYLGDLIRYAQIRFAADFTKSLACNGFVRYRKYGRSDVFRILGATENPVAQNVGGYLIDPDAKAWCPIFITYEKHAAISATTKYEDEFIDRQTLRYFTKNRRKLSSPDVTFFRTATPEQIMPLFIKKNNDEGIEFYYIGELRPVLDSFRQKSMADSRGGTVSVVSLIMKLDKPVDEALYDYITQ